MQLKKRNYQDFDQVYLLLHKSCNSLALQSKITQQSGASCTLTHRNLFVIYSLVLQLKEIV